MAAAVGGNNPAILAPIALVGPAPSSADLIPRNGTPIAAAWDSMLPCTCGTTCPGISPRASPWIWTKLTPWRVSSEWSQRKAFPCEGFPTRFKDYLPVPDPSLTIRIHYYSVFSLTTIDVMAPQAAAAAVCQNRILVSGIMRLPSFGQGPLEATPCVTRGSRVTMNSVVGRLLSFTL